MNHNSFETRLLFLTIGIVVSFGFLSSCISSSNNLKPTKSSSSLLSTVSPIIQSKSETLLSETPSLESNSKLTKTRTFPESDGGLDTPTATPKPKIPKTETPQYTATDFPDERQYSFSSPDGKWIWHELFDWLEAQVISKDQKTKWVITYKDVKPIYGTDFNWFWFRKDAVYFGIGPENYEIQILQRSPISYSLYRLDLTNGLIAPILEVKYDNNKSPIETYFDVSTDETKVVYSRWYERTIIIRDLNDLAEEVISLPTDYLIAGPLLWSLDDTYIILTMWKDDYELSIDYAVARLDTETLSLSILLQENETKYFLVPYYWIDENNIVLIDRRYGNNWEMNTTSGRLKPYPTATVSP